MEWSELFFMFIEGPNPTPVWELNALHLSSRELEKCGASGMVKSSAVCTVFMHTVSQRAGGATEDAAGSDPATPRISRVRVVAAPTRDLACCPAAPRRVIECIGVINGRPAPTYPTQVPY